MYLYIKGMIILECKPHLYLNIYTTAYLERREYEAYEMTIYRQIKEWTEYRFQFVCAGKEIHKGNKTNDSAFPPQRGQKPRSRSWGVGGGVGMKSRRGAIFWVGSMLASS